MQSAARTVGPTKGPSVVVVAPNSFARAHGLKEELRVGWKHSHNNMVWWWGSAKNRAALKQLIKDLESKYGSLTIEERDTDIHPTTCIK
jgi:hypothetical protein